MIKAMIIVTVIAAAAGVARAAAAAPDEADLSVGDRIIRQHLPGCGPTIELWPGKAPDEANAIPAEGATGEEKGSVLRLQNVSRPTITVSRPKSSDSKTQTPAVIVCPGGGYGILAARKEGTEIVQWLNSHGVTGVLLKYRVPRRQKDGDLKHRHALQDAQRAMGLVRLNAKDWGIDPNRVGILGFSAGGHLSATACNNYAKRTYQPADEADKLSCKPDFAVLIYPAYLTTGRGLGDMYKLDPLQHADAMSAKTTPPTFIAVSEFDGFAGSGMGYFAALAKAKVPAALHVYPGGRHGTGMQVYPLSRWGNEAAQWMRDLKIIPEKTPAATSENNPSLPKACIAGTEAGWKAMAEADFANVNCDKDTWTWKDGMIHCTGKPTGVIQSKKSYKNFELVLQWRHLQSAGNSGVFVWATEASLAILKQGKGSLPKGIECQILDHGYAENYIKKTKKKPDWFTTNGDVFPVGVKMKPFPPLSANGSRSFPSKNLSKGVNQWNHYYIRCINGEVRLWVNGEEVSGGTACQPGEGYICLESEGSPIDFKNLRIRELP